MKIGIFWKHLLERGLPSGAAGRIALPIAGEDPAGKELVTATDAFRSAA